MYVYLLNLANLFLFGTWLLVLLSSSTIKTISCKCFKITKHLLFLQKSSFVMLGLKITFPGTGAPFSLLPQHSQFYLPKNFEHMPDHHSYTHNLLYAVVKLKPENKFRPEQDSNPMTSAIPVQCSTN